MPFVITDLVLTETVDHLSYS